MFENVLEFLLNSKKPKVRKQSLIHIKNHIFYLVGDIAIVKDLFFNKTQCTKKIDKINILRRNSQPVLHYIYVGILKSLVLANHKT
jgi:hypothetical protein